MYVVRRPFRNLGQMMLPGSLVEPGDIKFFKSRLRDRVIIEVGEHNLDEYNRYFRSKFGVSIKPKEEPKKVVKLEEATKPEVPKAKVVVKAN